ncbi:unnamed protein product [Sphenostylis stenocarpa]|uniref:Uncharacterized protein n=1 Tax=Sphenostylis stenocarpa TaxID=92480 RepID=A0AA86VFK9_9FABA|nr:unnamed protein product [Sphenostylis stenocarpa]
MRATLDSRMRFFVRNAFLTRLTYNNTTNTLHYNLTVEVAIPAEHATIDYLSAAVSYHNITFASHPVETLIQDFNGLRLRFDGERYIMLTHVQLSKVNYDNMSGFYNLTLNLWPPKMRTPEELLCDLQLPIHHYVRCNGIDD